MMLLLLGLSLGFSIEALSDDSHMHAAKGVDKEDSLRIRCPREGLGVARHRVLLSKEVAEDKSTLHLGSLGLGHL